MENSNKKEPEKVPAKVYPLATTDGYYYEDENAETLGIETKVHENKRKVLRVVLADGTTAIVRTLKGRDIELANRFHEGDQTKYTPAIIAIATTLNGESKVMEDFLELDAPDYNRIRRANMQLNF